MRIWVVEDNRRQRKNLVDYLELFGSHEVKEFINGDEFNEYIDNFDVEDEKDIYSYFSCHCIFMDINMPPRGKTEGIELAKKLREKFAPKEKKYGKQPVIVFQTGYDIPEDEFLTEPENIIFLKKPYAFEEVDEVIEKIRREKNGA